MFNVFDQFGVITILGYLSNVSIMMLVILGLIVLYIHLQLTCYNLIPTRPQTLQEIVYTHFSSLVGSSRQEATQLNLTLTVLIFMAGLNILGIFPYIYAPTAHIAVTVSISLSIIIGTTIMGVSKYGEQFLSKMLPEGAPMSIAGLLVIVETISYLSRILSLGFRVAANITAGHVLLAIISTFGYIVLNSGLLIFSTVPMLILVPITMLEIAVALIQAYVFCLLTSVYINETLNMH